MPALPALASLVVTYVFMLVVLLVGVKRLGADVKKFAGGFTVVFGLSYVCWFLGSWAYIAATPNQRAGFKIAWSLNLTNESGFIIALLAGLFIGNFMPGLAEKIKEAIRPELYIKTAIVILGGFLGIAALNQRQLATQMMFRGVCAIVEAYLIYWPLVYFISRKYFKFSREWAAPSGLRHFHLRCFGGHRHRRRNPRAANRSHHGLVAGGDLLGGGTADPAVCGPALSLALSQWWPAPGWAWPSRPTARPWPAERSPIR